MIPISGSQDVNGADDCATSTVGARSATCVRIYWKPDNGRNSISAEQGLNMDYDILHLKCSSCMIVASVYIPKWRKTMTQSQTIQTLADKCETTKKVAA